MNDIPKISDSEWEVMKVLWDKSPLTANEIVDAVSASKQWNHRTTRTLIDRLVKKGALKTQILDKVYSFSPSVAKEACIQHESESFLNRVFDGEASPLLAHFVKHRFLTKKEIEGLSNVLKGKEKV